MQVVRPAKAPILAQALGGVWRHAALRQQRRGRRSLPGGYGAELPDHHIRRGIAGQHVTKLGSHRRRHAGVRGVDDQQTGPVQGGLQCLRGGLLSRQGLQRHAVLHGSGLQLGQPRGRHDVGGQQHGLGGGAVQQAHGQQPTQAQPMKPAHHLPAAVAGT